VVFLRTTSNERQVEATKSDDGLERSKAQILISIRGWRKLEVERCSDANKKARTTVRTRVPAFSRLRAPFIASTMLEPRRRRLPLTALDNVATSSQESNVGSGEKRRNGKTKKRRRRRAKSCGKFRRRGVLWTVLSVMLVALLWRTGPSQSISESWLTRGWFTITSTREYHLEHGHFYDAVRHSATNGTQDDVPFQEKHPFTLTSTYGTRIMEQGCNLTVVFMDPRLATATSNEAAWFSLESVAAFCPDACILLQTGA
jgi:hypothetical protein